METIFIENVLKLLNLPKYVNINIKIDLNPKVKTFTEI